MQRPAVILALLVAIGLAIAAIVLVPRGAARDDAAATLGFAPSAVVELAIAAPGATPARVVRGESGAWTLAGPDAGWPVAPERIRPALRILADAAVEPDPGLEPPAEATAVAVRLDDGSERTLRLGARRLAGRVPAELVTPDGRAAGWAAGDLFDAFVKTGPLAWRDPAVFPLAGPETSRIRLAAGDRRIALARLQGRWHITEPAAAPADPQAVNRLLATLAAARVADFLDGQPAAPDAARVPDAPLAEVVLEADIRRPGEGGVESRTARNAATIGAARDLGGQRVFARIVRDAGDGRPPLDRLVALDRGSLDAITPDPAAYAARTTLQTAAADAAGLTLAAHPPGPASTFRRHLAGWARPGGGPAVLPEHAAALDALCTLLAETPAESVALSEPAGLTPLARIEASDLAGAPLAAIDASLAPAAAPGAPRLVLRVGPVWRTYSEQGSAAGLGALRALLAP